MNEKVRALKERQEQLKILANLYKEYNEEKRWNQIYLEKLRTEYAENQKLIREITSQS